MSRHQWSRSDGGVCNNCGEPYLAHVDDACPSPEQIRQYGDRIDHWMSIVVPARTTKERVRNYVKMLRTQHRHGNVSEADLAVAERMRELAQALYKRAIERADKQA